MRRLLIVEDDTNLAKLLQSDFELEGFDVAVARNGFEALEQTQSFRPEVILLDVMLPKMSGYDVCRTLRRQGNKTPILMLTAKGQETEKVVGFEMGADDYLTKPFGSMELLARVKALLRRGAPVGTPLETFEVDGLSVNFKRMEARKGKTLLALTHKEFQVLELLLRHRGEVVSRRQFLEEAWGYESLPTTRTVDNTILTLRQKLGNAPGDPKDYIVTVHGAGYKFVR